MKSILIADDSLLSRRLLEETLRGWGYDVIIACDGTAAWSILNSSDPPALAILDWMMPGHTGPELCRLVRAKAAEPYTYILLLTSRNEKEDVVEGLDSGADDYITKPFDRHELKVRLRAGTRIVDLQDQLLSTREALRFQATRDYLTHLWNRSAMMDLLEKELSRSARDTTSLGVVIADLDHFKLINDTHGHGVGDLALQEVAERMRRSVREYDHIGRHGGEEFLIVLPGADAHSARMLADRMRLAIKSEPLVVGGLQVRLSCSFGCTAIRGGARSAAELIRTADEALYAAKRGGRDRAVVIPLDETEVADLAFAAGAPHPLSFSSRPESDSTNSRTGKSHEIILLPSSGGSQPS
jgi:diguanylate cyclase (GGDEF)-like protein